MSENGASGWKHTVHRLALGLERGFDRAKRAVDERLRPDRPVVVVPYRGYGTDREVLIHGRVLRDPGVRRARPGDPWWRNLVQTFRLMESDEVAGARVTVRFAGMETAAVADEEGLFHARVELPDRAAPAAVSRPWDTARVVVDDPALAHLESEPAAAPILIPAAAARFGVISDLDDTVIHTNATSLWRMVRLTLFENAYTRLAFPGVAEFFRALHQGDGAGANPLFYVSSSPWNLYDVLTHFLELKELPRGPLVLRDWGLGNGPLRESRHHAHKLGTIREIMRVYPQLPFILVGDSGQKDPEIYRDVVHEHPGRVLAVYIRNVSPDPMRERSIRSLAEEVRQAGSSLVLSRDTLGAARHAAEHGWIEAGALERVAGSDVRHGARPVEHERRKGAAPPTVVVDR